jgi:hypothetical protein
VAVDLGEFEDAANVDELKKALVRAQRKLALRDAVQADLAAAVYRAAKDAALAMPKLKAPTVRKPRRGSSNHAALLHTTDWQRGKRTKDFDADILDQRLDLMVAKALTLSERHGHPVGHCTLLLGGDMIEGMTIFPGQAWEINQGIFEQVFGCATAIKRIVIALLAHFPTVHVVEEYGNHGRIGRFGELPQEDNLDRVSYRVAHDQLMPAYEGRLTWQESTEAFMVKFAIGNYEGLLLHGNEFNRSFSAQRITSKLTAWQTHPEWGGFTDAYIGHLHRRDSYGLPNGGMAYLTGSPETSNAYAAEVLAATSAATQRLHFVDPDAGMVVAEHILTLS